MIIFRYILIYMIILGFSMFFAELFKKKLEKTILLSLLTILILLYLFGMMNILKIGVFFVSLLGIGLLFYTILKTRKNKTGRTLKEKFLSPGNIFFTILFFVFVITTFSKELTNWDQFLYWSLSAKDMFYTDNILLTVVGHYTGQALPFQTLLGYFFMKIVGEYRQGIEIFATWLLGFSCFLPLFDKSNGKRIVNCMISILILCVPAVFSMLIFYESSYPDALLGIFVGYLMYLYFCEEKSKFTTFCMVMTMIGLTLTDRTGVIFAGIIWVSFLLYEMLGQKKENLRKNIKKFFLSKEMKILYLLFFTIAITYFSWTIYVKIEGIKVKKVETYDEMIGKKEIETVTQSILTTVFGVYAEDDNAANSNGTLLEKLYNIPEISTPVKISAGGFICICGVIGVFYYSRVEQSKKKKVRNIFISIFAGLILYILARQYGYITRYSVKEMLAHDGMERYMASYLLAILYFLVAFTLTQIKTKPKTIFYVLLTSVIIMITPLTSVANATITSGIFNLNSTYYCNTARNKAKKILSVVPKQEKVLGVCQTGEFNILLNLMIRYYMYPTSYQLDAFQEEKEEQITDIVEKKEYSYIYILVTDAYLTNQLEEKFGIQVKDDTLLRITEQGLEKVK